jgi:16S rRNA (guanine966-N2)-methyltransferase
MRIIGGREAGLRIATPKGQGVRPTQDRVREAIFNRLAANLVGANVLDLFSGTGAMGLESISRGAASVLSIEKSAQHGRTIEQNIKVCGYNRDRIQLRIGCAFSALRHLVETQQRFDLIFADPPFGDKTTTHRSKSMTQILLDDPNLQAIAKINTLVIVGHASRDKVEISDNWTVAKQKKYGDATINFLTKQSKPPGTKSPTE